MNQVLWSWSMLENINWHAHKILLFSDHGSVCYLILFISDLYFFVFMILSALWSLSTVRIVDKFL